MKHDDECAWNEDDCGCRARARRRKQESADAALAYRWIMLGGTTTPATYPMPVIARPVRIAPGARFGLTKDGAFTVPFKRTG